jgi:hypothetical protein
MQTISLENVLRDVKNRVDQTVFGERVGLFGKLFGCWHEDLSRPFVQNNTAYRTCLNCGARRQFDTRTLQTFGAYYYPPIVRKIAENA